MTRYYGNGSGITTSASGIYSPGDYAAAIRQRQMQAERAMQELKEQEYNIMRTAHLEEELVEQEAKETDEEIYYLLTQN